jgi:hypothetical protein
MIHVKLEKNWNGSYQEVKNDDNQLQYVRLHVSLLMLSGDLMIFTVLYSELTNKAIFLCFSVLRPCAGRFLTTKVAKRTKENFHKNILFMEFSFNCIMIAKVL